MHIFDLIGILTAGCGCALSSKIAQLSSNITICTGLHLFFEWWWSPQQATLSTQRCANSYICCSGWAECGWEVQQLQCSNEENPQREAKRWWIIQLCVQLVNLRSFFLTLVSSTRHQCLGLDDSGRRLRKPRVKNWIINSYWGMIIHPWIGLHIYIYTHFYMHTYSKMIPSMGWMMLDIPCFDHGRRRPPLVLKCQKMPVRRCLGTRRAEQTPALRLSCPKVAELPAQVLDKHLWMQALYMHHECMFMYNLYDIHVYKHMFIYIHTCLWIYLHLGRCMRVCECMNRDTTRNCECINNFLQNSGNLFGWKRCYLSLNSASTLVSGRATHMVNPMP